MKNYLIIMGHGNYATGMKSALDLIMGSKEEVIALDFLKDESDQDYQEKVLKIINSDNYLIACDILGGTPYKIATSLKLSGKNIEVVTGANLGGLLDTAIKLDKQTITELANNTVDSSLKSLLVVPDVKLEEKKPTNGI